MAEPALRYTLDDKIFKLVGKPGFLLKTAFLEDRARPSELLQIKRTSVSHYDEFTVRGLRLRKYRVDDLNVQAAHEAFIRSYHDNGLFLCPRHYEEMRCPAHSGYLEKTFKGILESRECFDLSLKRAELKNGHVLHDIQKVRELPVELQVLLYLRHRRHVCCALCVMCYALCVVRYLLIE